MKKVLVCCEESQVVCLAFRNAGCLAFSCDLQDCSGGFPCYHIKQDCLTLINGNCYFTTMDNQSYYVDKWDLIIAHPPCTYLCLSGVCNLLNKNHTIKNFDRLINGILARDFFMQILNADCPHICVENPKPIAIFELPKKSQSIQPYEFGHFCSKNTYLWLKGLPILMPEDICVSYSSYVITCGTKGGRSKRRSKTFPGVAQAMVNQWLDFI